METNSLGHDVEQLRPLAILLATRHGSERRFRPLNVSDPYSAGSITQSEATVRGSQKTKQNMTDLLRPYGLAINARIPSPSFIDVAYALICRPAVRDIVDRRSIESFAGEVPKRMMMCTSRQELRVPRADDILGGPFPCSFSMTEALARRAGRPVTSLAFDIAARASRALRARESEIDAWRGAMRATADRTARRPSV